MSVTATWLDVLLTPHLVQPTPNASPRPLALHEATAMLLSGRGQWLDQRFREASDLPTTDDVESPGAAFFVGADHYHAGDVERALDLFLRASSATDAPADLRAAAAALASIASSDQRRLDRALDIVRTVHAQLQEPVDSEPTEPADLLQRSIAVLALHVGWRTAEAGKWEQAVTTTEAAAALTQDDETAVGQLVAYVAAWNLFHFQFRTGSQHVDLETLQQRPIPRSVLEPRTRAASAMSKLIARRTEARLAGPFSSGITFVAEDEVDRGLWAAVLRAACLADYSAVRLNGQGRATAKILLAADEGEEIPPRALWELRATGAAKPLARAARWQLRRGPLTTLTDEIASLAHGEWWPSHEEATLKLIAAAGDLSSPRGAELLVERLLTIVDGDEPGTRRTFRADLAALEALPSTLHAAPDAAHTLVAERLLALLTTPSAPPAVLAHALPRVISVLRWAVISHELLVNWQRTIEDLTPEAGDYQATCAAAVSEISTVDFEWAQRMALEAYQQHRDPQWAAILVDLAAPLSAEVATEIATGAIDRVRDERRQAQQGRYSIGSVRDGMLLGALILNRPDLDGWADVCWYLADRDVALDDKVPVANLITSRRNQVEDSMREQLSLAVANGLYGRRFWEPTRGPKEAVGAGLRLAFAFELGDPATLHQRLLELAHDAEVSERIEACWTVPYAHVLGPSVAPLALHLTYDQHHEVRAAAAASCVRVSTELSSRAEDLALLRHRIRQLLTGEGTAVPGSLLRALHQASPAAARPYASEVMSLARDHPAASVRRAASTLVDDPRRERPD